MRSISTFFTFLLMLTLPFEGISQTLNSSKLKTILTDSDGSFLELKKRKPSVYTLPGYDCKLVEHENWQTSFYADDITKEKGKKLDKVVDENVLIIKNLLPADYSVKVVEASKAPEFYHTLIKPASTATFYVFYKGNDYNTNSNRYTRVVYSKKSYDKYGYVEMCIQPSQELVPLYNTKNALQTEVSKIKALLPDIQNQLNKALEVYQIGFDEDSYDVVFTKENCEIRVSLLMFKAYSRVGRDYINISSIGDKLKVCNSSTKKEKLKISYKNEKEAEKAYAEIIKLNDAGTNLYNIIIGEEGQKLANDWYFNWNNHPELINNLLSSGDQISVSEMYPYRIKNVRIEHKGITELKFDLGTNHVKENQFIQKFKGYIKNLNKQFGTGIEPIISFELKEKANVSSSYDVNKYAVTIVPGDSIALYGRLQEIVQLTERSQYLQVEKEYLDQSKGLINYSFPGCFASNQVQEKIGPIGEELMHYSFLFTKEMKPFLLKRIILNLSKQDFMADFKSVKSASPSVYQVEGDDYILYKNVNGEYLKVLLRDYDSTACQLLITRDYNGVLTRAIDRSNLLSQIKWAEWQEKRKRSEAERIRKLDAGRTPVSKEHLKKTANELIDSLKAKEYEIVSFYWKDNEVFSHWRIDDFYIYESFSLLVLTSYVRNVEPKLTLSPKLRFSYSGQNLDHKYTNFKNVELYRVGVNLLGDENQGSFKGAHLFDRLTFTSQNMHGGYVIVYAMKRKGF